MMGNIEDVRAKFEAAEDVAPAEGLAPNGGGRFDGHSGNGPPPRTPDLPQPEIEGAKLPLNDTGNGRRFALYYGDQALCVPRVGWHIWDGKRWKLDPDEIAVRRLAQMIQDCLIKEIPHLELEEWQQAAIDQERIVRPRHDALNERKLLSRRKTKDTQASVTPLTVEEEIELEELQGQLEWIKKCKDRRASMKSDHRSFAKTTGNKGRIDALLTEVKTSLSREIEDLDADALVVNTESGLLRFSVSGGAGEGFSKTARVSLLNHERYPEVDGRARPQVITKIMPVDYDPSANCPGFEAFLCRVQPDPEMRAFLQRWWGLSLTGLPIQKFVFQYGKGANGKSVLSDLMRRMLGDYAAVAKIESITGRNQRGASDAAPDIMLLRGARAGIVNEAEEGQKLQEKTIKDMTSFEPMLARNLFGDFISFVMLAKLTISGNHKPDIRGTDDGIWRRVLLVPFDVQIPEAERDDKLIDKLWEERSGILNWLIDGLIDYLEGGLQEPDQVLSATQEYRADSDPIGSFLGDSCVVTGASDDFLSARELIDGFNLWMDQRGEGMWGQRTVSLKIKAEAGRYRDPTTNRPFTKGKRDVTGYRGIKFTDAFRATYDNAPRNTQGRPVAFTASSGGAASSPDDYPQ